MDYQSSRNCCENRLGFLAVSFQMILVLKSYLDLPKANHPTDDIHKDFDHDHLQLGFQFLADMINRFMFFIIILVQD